jgi:hypothetical protein
MKTSKFIVNGVLALATLWLFATTPYSTAIAQFNESSPGGPIAIGQVSAQVDQQGRVAIIQAPAPAAAQGGGIIQLSAFGWLQPYVDSVVQALLAAGLAWIAKSKYTQWMDQSARDALETFSKNTASSLIADGFVKMQGKTVTVHSAALANEVNTAADRIPDAMKRFGLTPGVIAQKIVDAIPQTPAGAAIVAAAHVDAPMPASVSNGTPPTAAAS